MCISYAYEAIGLMQAIMFDGIQLGFHANINVRIKITDRVTIIDNLCYTLTNSKLNQWLL